MHKPLIVVSESIKTRDCYQSYEDANSRPRRDYDEIARRLNARIVGYNLSDSTWYRWARRLERRIKIDIVESLAIAAHSGRYSEVLSSSEKAAIPLASLFHLTGQNLPHIIIGHKLSSGLKTRVLRMEKIREHFSHVICVARRQAEYAINVLGFPPSSVTCLYDKVDQRFFHPLPDAESQDYVLAVGKEQRDYATLVAALAPAGIRIVIVASSPWSSNRNLTAGDTDLTLLHQITYRDLRMLYAGARLVVVPLFEVDYAAGVNGLLEALAMGKAAVVTHTPGISDYVSHGETGMFVPAGNLEALRETVLRLWNHPRELQRLGANGRRAVEEKMNIDLYSDQVASIMQSVLTQSSQGSPTRR